MNLEIIAEFGTNNIDSEGKVLGNIKELIITLARKGAHVIKFQKFKADNIVKRSEKSWSIIKGLELPIDEHVRFKNYCEEAGVKYLCTPFCTYSLDTLLEIGLREIKIASCDCGNVQFISDITKRSHKIDRVIMSTGMSKLSEIEDSVDILMRGEFRIDLLHCVSIYPTPIYQASLGMIRSLKKNYGMFCDNIGYSDHTIGCDTARIARAMGCTIFEKHVTPDVNMPGLDHAYSFPVNEFEKYVESIKEMDLIIGEDKKIVLKDEEKSREGMKRGVWFKRSLNVGQEITMDDVMVCRPLKGTLNQTQYLYILGKRIRKAAEPGDPVILDYLY